MAVVSKWLCGSCIAQDVLFSFHARGEKLFVVCAACGASSLSLKKGTAEIIEMDSTARELKGSWTLATIEDVKSAGYESQVESVVPSFYEHVLESYPSYRK